MKPVFRIHGSTFVLCRFTENYPLRRNALPCDVRRLRATNACSGSKSALAHFPSPNFTFPLFDALPCSSTGGVSNGRAPPQPRPQLLSTEQLKSSFRSVSHTS